MRISLSMDMVGSIPVLRSPYGSPQNSSISLDNVVCTGGESDLTECDHNGLYIHNCDDSELAGVHCDCKEALLRIMTDYSIFAVFITSITL